MRYTGIIRTKVGLFRKPMPRRNDSGYTNRRSRCEMPRYASERNKRMVNTFSVTISAITDCDHMNGLKANRSPAEMPPNAETANRWPASRLVRLTIHATSPQLSAPKNADMKFTPHAGFGWP